jgi:hypothetical protein
MCVRSPLGSGWGGEEEGEGFGSHSRYYCTLQGQEFSLFHLFDFLHNPCMQLFVPMFYQQQIILFCIFFWRARVCWPLFCICRPFRAFKGCMNSSVAVASGRATNLAIHLSKLFFFVCYMRSFGSILVKQYLFLISKFHNI